MLSPLEQASPGLGGCALSQIGNVGPDLGQNYIIDSFMVVVLGGVGQLAGTIIGAMGLGVHQQSDRAILGRGLGQDRGPHFDCLVYSKTSERFVRSQRSQRRGLK